MTNEKNAFIAIVGKPNVGKSSILNRILGEKIAIVSPKPQTTRTKIMGVLTKDDVQLVFIDTPGLLKPKNALDNYMVRAISNSVADVDACLLVVEAGQDISKSDSEFIAKFKQQNIPCILAINKIDLFKDKSILMEQIAKYSDLYNFTAVVPVSAKHGENTDILIDELSKLSSEGPHLFENDTLTDQPERVIAGEIIREKILRLTDKEIPHGTAIVIEKLKQRTNSEMIDIDATIYCEKDSHKGILLGKGGSMIKKIGTYARADLEKFFDSKINLSLWVKVKEDWRNRENLLHTFGYDSNDFQ